MARPIWSGSLSFGLLNIPIRLMAGERRTDIHFRMLDSRTKDPVRYERVNAETGEEVPWKEIVKAYEYSKGHYVVLDKADIERAAAENNETIALDAFVERDCIPAAYLDKPYVLAPGKKAEKGYVLLREVLRNSGRVGIGRVVIRTREYLAMVTVESDALMLILLRFPQEIVDPAEYNVPTGDASEFGVSAKELKMAQQLLETMSDEWEPSQYKDEFRERLQAVIKQRIAEKDGTTKIEETADDEAEPATNVVDFMALLQQSLKGKDAGKAPAPAKAARKSAKKTTRKSSKRA
ncbi:Ku protein [Cognatilysobacter bugurensis]|uniref:Non-homologous end joining protein Ku n=1 Tax=Cognatilysobacter bugurensis TaxID=543356 RepID=A0A918T371_9GAMM|nr:Ku protein [Lysobacter bugurensis]GHA83633.1 non-homologous end joining protein Ku [Lysobacter bugurensis]